MTRRFDLIQTDVFTETPLSGNPLAVLPDARGLDEREMQAIAQEMNLSETTFVLPAERPGADYRVRIFTPRAELPFAGHPTLGTAHVLIETGRVPVPDGDFSLHQQTLAGVQAVDVRGTPGARDLTMTQPTPSFEPGPPLEELCAALGVEKHAAAGDPLTISVGVQWHVLPLASLAVVRGLDPDMSALTALEARTGVALTVFCREAEAADCSVRVRSFAPGSGIPEDPVCGSGNGCVGAYLAHTGSGDEPLVYTAEQGVELGRAGRVQVRVERGSDGFVVQVGGRAVTLFSGELTLPAR